MFLLLAACGSKEAPRALVEPEFAASSNFSTERYLRDDQIAKDALRSERNALADQLLGIRPEKEQMATAAAPRPTRRRARRVDYADTFEEEDDLEVGVLTDGAFQDAIQSWSGMRRCIAEATTRGNRSNGALRVAFRIRGDGAVASSKVIDTSNAMAQAIAPCVERSARRIQFPAYGGDTIKKEAKFVF